MTVEWVTWAVEGGAGEAVERSGRELVSRKRARDARPYGIWGDMGLVFSEAAEFSLEIVDLTAHVGDGIGG